MSTSDEYTDAFAVFVVAMSDYIETEAHRYGFEYIEMGRRAFSDVVTEVVDSLMADSGQHWRTETTG